MGSTQTNQKQHAISQSAMNTHTRPSDGQSLYAQSTASSKAPLSSRFGSFAKLPLLSRSKPSTAASHRSTTPVEASGGKQQKPRDAVKSIPSNKPPVTTFADLAYRYGAPNTIQFGRL